MTTSAQIVERVEGEMRVGGRPWATLHEYDEPLEVGQRLVLLERIFRNLEERIVALETAQHTTRKPRTRKVT